MYQLLFQRRLNIVPVRERNDEVKWAHGNGIMKAKTLAYVTEELLHHARRGRRVNLRYEAAEKRRRCERRREREKERELFGISAQGQQGHGQSYEDGEEWCNLSALAFASSAILFPFALAGGKEAVEERVIDLRPAFFFFLSLFFHFLPKRKSQKKIPVGIRTGRLSLRAIRRRVDFNVKVEWRARDDDDDDEQRKCALCGHHFYCLTWRHWKTHGHF